MALNEKLKTLRKARHLTQDEFAKQTGIGRSATSMYESGKREPNYDTLRQIAKFYDVSTDYLLGNDDTPPKVVPLIKENEFSEKEKERMRKIRQLAKHTQDYIDDTINREYAHQVEPPQPFKKVAM